ncbi:CcdB family protein [Paraglaciecola aquimarina]|uniref:Toxin CcdB n=1 Tax=Paraglaciecola algarum TaxID=3050085 RepID=A0ABS9D1H7_9ALTE|nr:CcdB family protein [Paraglaciecola sp. G1-23]
MIPLGNARAFQNKTLNKLTPTLDYEGNTYLILTPQLTSMPPQFLQNPIGSMRSLRE